MAASMLQAFAVEYSYQSASQPAVDHELPNAYFSFSSNSGGIGFETISTNTHTSTSEIQGFLYVPNFNTSNPCLNITAPLVPNNVTTADKLPPNTVFPYIAFGPWIPNNEACVKAYLDSANSLQARAFVTYLPGNVNLGNASAAAPPNSSDPTWYLDGSNSWTQEYGFPVYAMNSNDGSFLINQLALFSGTLGDLPNLPGASAIINTYGNDTSVRLYMEAQVMASSELPSLWVFLLIVVAILVGVLLLASVVMRIIQRRRRSELRAMIFSGQVDLEALGIARVKVTRELLDKMPLYIYVENGDTPRAPHAPPTETADTATAESGAADSPEVKARPGILGSISLFNRTKPSSTPSSSRSRTNLPSILEEKVVSFPQETCVICLDDYENHVTAVRWLPCGHVFHPACIDPLLQEYSSLCPTCKASVLPKDYIPEVTNMMVRRERLMRRLRDLEAREIAHEQRFRNGPAHFRGIQRFLPRTSGATAQDRAASTGGAASTSQPVELQAVGTSTAAPPAAQSQASASAQGAAMVNNTTNSDESQPVERQVSAVSATAENGARRPENVSREEWARQRAEALLGTSETVEQAEQREHARLPLWRRALGPVFPTLRS